jgi:hypothetical protein
MNFQESSVLSQKPSPGPVDSLIYLCKTTLILSSHLFTVDPGPGNETGQVGQEAVAHASKSYQWRTTGIIFIYNCELHKTHISFSDSSVPTFVDMYTSRNKQISTMKKSVHRILKMATIFCLC